LAETADGDTQIMNMAFVGTLDGAPDLRGEMIQ
jgi:hypothetical protein